MLRSTAAPFSHRLCASGRIRAEDSIAVPHWSIFTGQASYSYMLGTCYLPVTGGLFPGDEATRALDRLTAGSG